MKNKTWKVGFDTGYKTIVSELNGFAVCEVLRTGAQTPEDLQAKANLIAAAPELLKAVEWLYSQLHDDKGRQTRIYNDTLAPDCDEATVEDYLFGLIQLAKG